MQSSTISVPLKNEAALIPLMALVVERPFRARWRRIMVAAAFGVATVIAEAVELTIFPTLPAPQSMMSEKVMVIGP